MFEKQDQMDEQLDRVGRVVLNSATGSDADIEAAATAPFAFARLRAAIGGEERRRDESGGWFSILLVARRAVPGMALIAIMAAIMTVWSGQLSVPPTTARFDDEAMFDARDSGVEQAILTSNNSLSGEEVFSIVVDANGKGNK